jgi:hypothetical protein
MKERLGTDYIYMIRVCRTLDAEVSSCQGVYAGASLSYSAKPETCNLIQGRFRWKGMEGGIILMY